MSELSTSLVGFINLWRGLFTILGTKRQTQFRGVFEKLPDFKIAYVTLVELFFVLSASSYNWQGGGQSFVFPELFPAKDDKQIDAKQEPAKQNDDDGATEGGEKRKEAREKRKGGRGKRN